jgi:hypothetical protein
MMREVGLLPITAWGYQYLAMPWKEAMEAQETQSSKYAALEMYAVVMDLNRSWPDVSQSCKR